MKNEWRIIATLTCFMESSWNVIAGTGRISSSVHGLHHAVNEEPFRVLKLSVNAGQSLNLVIFVYCELKDYLLLHYELHFWILGKACKWCAGSRFLSCRSVERIPFYFEVCSRGAPVFFCPKIHSLPCAVVIAVRQIVTNTALLHWESKWQVLCASSFIRQLFQVVNDLFASPDNTVIKFGLNKSQVTLPWAVTNSNCARQHCH